MLNIYDDFGYRNGEFINKKIVKLYTNSRKFLVIKIMNW